MAKLNHVNNLFIISSLPLLSGKSVGIGKVLKLVE